MALLSAGGLRALPDDFYQDLLRTGMLHGLLRGECDGSLFAFPLELFNAAALLFSAGNLVYVFLCGQSLLCFERQ